MTIATGFDLGQHEPADLVRLFGDGTPIHVLLVPSTRLRKDEAIRSPASHPLTVTEEQAAAIDGAAKGEKATIIARAHDAAVTARRDRRLTPFRQLPREAQTVIMSVGLPRRQPRRPDAELLGPRRVPGLAGGPCRPHGVRGRLLDPPPARGAASATPDAGEGARPLRSALTLGMLLVAGAASAEPTPLSNLPSSVEGVETGLTHFVDCADYIAHSEVAQLEAEQRSGSTFDCEVAYLMSRAETSEDPAPSACDLLDAAMNRLDLRSYANISQPRLPKDAGPTTLEDLYEVSVAEDCSGAEAEDEGTAISVTPLATGDWTGDGVADGLVEIVEKAMEGTYLTVHPLVLTGLDGPRVTGLSVCAFLDLEEPDRCVSDPEDVVK